MKLSINYKKYNIMDPFIAQIVMFGGNFAPRGWAKCDGQLLAISSNTALFSLLGTTYGGDGRTTFALPDMRGRTPVHPGSGPGLSTILQGPGGGRQSVVLTVNELPSHSHATASKVNARFIPPTGGGNLSNPNAATFSSDGSQIYSNEATNVEMASNSVQVTVGNTGNQQPFNIRNPYCAVQFIIALIGVFPSRN